MQKVPADEMPLEFMMNALRLCEGVDAALYPQRTGVALSSLASTLQRMQHQGLLQATNNKVVPTALGLQHLNSLLLEFT